MRRYYDLGLAPGTRSDATQMLRTARELGFHGVTVEVEDSALDELRASAEGIELYSRTTLTPKSPNDLYRELRRVRWRHHVIAVRVFSRELLMAALRDSRVDLVVAPVNQMITIDHHVAEVSRNAIELQFSSFLKNPEAFAAWLLRSSRWIERRRVTVVVTSGASRELEMRRPIQLASLLAGMGFRVDLALDSVSNVPSAIAVENARRLLGLSDSRGVWVLEGEEEVPRS
ncbi:MAG: RNase P subunit p30 family protein [Thaumarchaeota archaeon]|nr:RNase P subunit p30 family protein [Candidatus Calditenuaceae archaeon]MDW8187289.1 RNase P subunit p30 family protein [Nitrososphaerota archaeon]